MTLSPGEVTCMQRGNNLFCSFRSIMTTVCTEMGGTVSEELVCETSHIYRIFK